MTSIQSTHRIWKLEVQEWLDLIWYSHHVIECIWYQPQSQNISCKSTYEQYLTSILSSFSRQESSQSAMNTNFNTDQISPVVDLGYAQYRGNTLTSGVDQYLGMRYAEPPVGNLRFRAPAPPVFQTELQDALAVSPPMFSTWEYRNDNWTS